MDELKLIPDIEGPQPDKVTTALRSMAIIKDAKAFFARCADGSATPEDLARHMLATWPTCAGEPFERVLAWVNGRFPTREEFDVAMREDAEMRAQRTMT